MDNKNISPALYETAPGQMSSQEFQRMLYTWFEEKGLVADLRSYLRVLMINKLRNTTVGKFEQNKPNFSLPKQAFNLVIAEHLLREGCHYTLSIFSTEVPGVANQIPLSLFEAHCCKENDWRFDQDSVLNVLELVGISKNSNESLRIAGLYFRNHGSLLTCMVSSKTLESGQDYKIDDKDCEDIGDYLHRILSVLEVPTNVVDEVRRRINLSIVKERDTNSAEAQKHFGRIVDELKAQLEAKNHQIKELIDEQVAQKNGNKKLKRDLKDTRKRLNSMILQEKSIKLKGEQIKERLNEISRLEEGLKESLNRSRDKIQDSCPQKHCGECCDTTRKLSEELQKEMVRMQELDQTRIVEIERLNHKVSSLVKDLQNSQIKIEFLNSCLRHSNQINLPHEKSHDSSEETDSLTEEILKDVRSKLLELERESDALETKFKKLQMK